MTAKFGVLGFIFVLKYQIKTIYFYSYKTTAVFFTPEKMTK